LIVHRSWKEKIFEGIRGRNDGCSFFAKEVPMADQPVLPKRHRGLKSKPPRKDGRRAFLAYVGDAVFKSVTEIANKNRLHNYQVVEDYLIKALIRLDPEFSRKSGILTEAGFISSHVLDGQMNSYRRPDRHVERDSTGKNLPPRVENHQQLLVYLRPEVAICIKYVALDSGKHAYQVVDEILAEAIFTDEPEIAQKNGVRGP